MNINKAAGLDCPITANEALWYGENTPVSIKSNDSALRCTALWKHLANGPPLLFYLFSEGRSWPHGQL